MKNFLFTRLSLIILILSPVVATAQTVTWTSSTPAVATVNSTTGTITAIKEGTTTITSTTAAQNGKTVTATKTVQVAMQPQSGNIGSGTMSLAACNKTGTMTATVNYGSTLNNMDGSYYTWSSSNAAVATVSNTAKTQNLKSITITAKRNGSATISCSVERNGKILPLGSRTVTVSGINPTFKLNSTANISFTSTSANVHRYATHSYPAGCTGTTPTFTYSSDNGAVATWSSNYVRRGTTDGTIYVRASANIAGTWSGNHYIHVTGQYCTSCFYHGGRQYCGVRLSNGQCWLDRNIGATRVATSRSDSSSYGCYYSCSASASACPSGWRLPSYSEASRMVSNQGISSSSSWFNSKLKFPMSGYSGSCNNSYAPQSGQYTYCHLSGNYTLTNASGPIRHVTYAGSNDCWYYTFPVRCIKN